MEGADVAAHLKANRRLAEALALRGTPTFIALDQLVPGAPTWLP
jgi:protein-disulfide isomerase